MIKWIIICVIGLIILGNLGFDVKKAIESKTAQSNLEYAKNIVIFVWDKYLHEPFTFIWNEIIVKYIWAYAKSFFDSKLKGSEMKLNTETSIEHSVLFS